MTTGGRQYKRREVFSNPRTQLRIVAVFALLAAMFAATSYHVAFRVLRVVRADVLGMEMAAPLKADMNVILNQQEQALVWQLSLMTFIVVFVMLMGGVVLSHRIGGPIYQLRTYLCGVARGGVAKRRIRFRKGDFFFDLADAFNEFQVSQGLLLPDEMPPVNPAPRGGVAAGPAAQGEGGDRNASACR